MNLKFSLIFLVNQMSNVVFFNAPRRCLTYFQVQIVICKFLAFLFSGEPEDYKTRGKYRSEPHNMYGQRAVFIWFRSLKNRIPLVSTIVVSYLACHIAREAI